MINYDLRKIRAVVFDVDGVLSRQTVTMSPEGEPLRTADIKDGYALQLAVRSGLKIAVITGGNTRAVKARYAALGLEDVYTGAADKREAYAAFREKHSLSDCEIIYVGDDIPDYRVMKLSGCPCCPKDAAAEIKDISVYVSARRGGEGVARDILEQVLRVQGKWMTSAEAFGW